MIELKEEQKNLLEMISKELNGKISYWICSSNNTKHNKIVIEYGQTKNERSSV